MNYLMTKLKIIFTDKLTLSVMLVSLSLLFLFIISASEIMRSDKVVIGLDRLESSTIAKEVLKVLDEEASTSTMLIDGEEAIEAIRTGEIDLYLDFDPEADQKISEGDHNNLASLYSDGISLYSVFYPDLILGGIIKEIQFGVVTHYLEDLDNESALLPLDTSIEMAREIHNKTYEERQVNYYIDQSVLANDGSLVRIEAANRASIFMKQILGIMMMLLHLLIMMIMVSQVEEHEYNISKRLKVSPMNKLGILVSKWMVGFIPMLIISLIVAMVIQASNGMTGLLNFHLLGELLKVVALLVTIMLGLSEVMVSTNHYVFVSLMLILISASLAGVFFDLSVMAQPIAAMAKLSPYSIAINEVMDLILAYR